MRVRTLFKLAALAGFIALLIRPRTRRAVAPAGRVAPVIDAEEVPESVAFDAALEPAFEPYRDDEDVAMEDGQNWVEHLEQDAAEDGLLPEHPIDMRDETGRMDLRDIPVADRGSGGPGGL